MNVCVRAHYSQFLTLSVSLSLSRARTVSHRIFTLAPPQRLCDAFLFMHPSMSVRDAMSVRNKYIPAELVIPLECRFICTEHHVM